jgi:IclR family KDG regulon transcriptional repressor
MEHDRPTKVMDSTLVKGLGLLEWLARQPRECGVSEVARALGLARSNAHRTLQTLVACGWAEQNPATSAYRPSFRLFELGSRVGAAADVTALLRPHLARAAAATGETIHLACLDGAEIVYLDKFDSPLPVAAYSRIGGRAPACCVASGKALLAAARPDLATLRALFGGELHAHTPNSIVDFDALWRELERTAARGYAENREEWRLGVCGLGVPVFDGRGQPVAAIGMSVPSIRFARAQARSLAAQLMTFALGASEALGFRPASTGADRDSSSPARGRASQETA